MLWYFMIRINIKIHTYLEDLTKIGNYLKKYN